MRRMVLLLLLAVIGVTACSSRDSSVATGGGSTAATSATSEASTTTDAGAIVPSTSSTLKGTTTSSSTTVKPVASTTSTSAANGTSGIRGTVYAGPQCPVQREGDTSCDDKPVPADVSITRPGGGEAAHARAGNDGRFSAAVAAGRYTVTASSPNAMSCETQEVDVKTATYTTITIRCDTGIR